MPNCPPVVPLAAGAAQVGNVFNDLFVANPLAPAGRRGGCEGGEDCGSNYQGWSGPGGTRNFAPVPGEEGASKIIRREKAGRRRGSHGRWRERPRKVSS
jgi:hypothetical protein